MSLTIKIPRKNNSASSGQESRRKSTRRRVTTDSEEDDYELSPTHSESKQRRKPAPRVKGQGEREDDYSLRDSTRVKPGGSKRPRDDPLSADEPEGQFDATVSPDVDSSATATATAASEAVKEEPASVSLPPFKKKRLPPIKKNKPPAIPFTNVAPNYPATGKPGPVPPEAKAGTGLQEASVDTLSALKRPKRVNKQQEVNLNDKSVYESLFKHSGGSIPRAGLNLKEKEERRRELDRMREEDRKRRAADSELVFDLRAQHNKITSFVERLQARRSGALWPNILAVAFRQERERDDHRRERVRGRQGAVLGKGKECEEVPEKS